MPLLFVVGLPLRRAHLRHAHSLGAKHKEMDTSVDQHEHKNVSELHASHAARGEEQDRGVGRRSGCQLECVPFRQQAWKGPCELSPVTLRVMSLSGRWFGGLDRGFGGTRLEITLETRNTFKAPIQSSTNWRTLSGYREPMLQVDWCLPSTGSL